MARPQKPPSERRTEYLHLRLSPTELSAIERYAAEASVTVAEYVRATAMKTPPRKRPARERTLAMLHYELNSIATNLAQLEAATGDGNFGAWAKFVGKDLIERTTDRTDLTALIESHHARINGVGVAVNAMARRANQGKDIHPDDVTETLTLLKDVLEPLRLKLKEPPRERDAPERDDGQGGRDAL